MSTRCARRRVVSSARTRPAWTDLPGNRSAVDPKGNQTADSPTRSAQADL